MYDVLKNPPYYVAPFQGTFYVPPRHVAEVAMVPPTAGDFAHGMRNLDTVERIVVTIDPGAFVLDPDDYR
jgi:hypothetical protein